MTTDEYIKSLKLTKPLKDKFKVLKELHCHLTIEDVDKLVNAKSDLHRDAIARDIIMRE